MVRKCLLTGLAVMLLVSLGGAIGCGGGGSPSSVVKAFYEAVNRGDISEAEEYLVPGTSLEGTTVAKLTGKIEKVEILSEQIGEVFGVKAAEVRVEIALRLTAEERVKTWDLPMQEGVQTILLEKYNGKWKIAFRF